jgi:hypothetical protein
MWILAKILCEITGVPRYKPDIEWSSKSWTHNVFRVYEMIFWRREGIRCEAMTGITEDGRYFYRAFTFEAKCAKVETYIRQYFAVLASVRVHVYEVAPQFGVVRAFPYSLAIAFDAKSVDSTQVASPKTWSHTCTGSNGWLNLIAWTGLATTPTAADYNSVSATLGSGPGTQNPGVGYYQSSIFYLASPSTGSNTASHSWTGGGNGFGYATSYSGVTSTGIGGKSSINDSSGTTFDSTLTAVGGGWVVWCGSGDGSFPTGATTGTLRSTAGSQWCLADSNGVVSAGSYAFGYTNSSGANGGINGMEFGVAASGGGGAAKVVPTLLLLGAG